MGWTAERYHDISVGHRVYGHESKCAHLHGHNYRIHFHCRAAKGAHSLDRVGRVIDFSVIKHLLCQWLEDEWDHKFLLWQDDPLLPHLQSLDPQGVVGVPFNPTAENIAEYLVNVVAPVQLKGSGVELAFCRVEETRKCAASYEAE
jgi:6-pyruvoyltetrahydropterin/6-carboxytetrahydropterin synthase